MRTDQQVAEFQVILILGIKFKKEIISRFKAKINKLANNYYLMLSEQLVSYHSIM